MKKIFAILLAVVLVFSLSATAFAAEADAAETAEVAETADNFVNSAANAGVPEIVSIVDANGNDVTSLIKITSYIDRDELGDDAAEDMKDAYASLKNAEDLAAVNDDLKEAASDKSIAVSDLFDISAMEEVVFPLTITIKNSNLDNFVALLHFVDGEWEWVDAEVKDDELTFTVDSLSPFAIIVAAEPATSAQTGETASVGFIAAAVVLAVAAGYFFSKSRKVEA